MLKTVHVMIDPLNPASTETVEVEDLTAYLRTRWTKFPDNGRIYHEAIAVDHDVTPHSEADCERLKAMPGPFYVVVFPGETVLVAFIVAVVVAAATYFLTPAPRIPVIPSVTQRNQQTSSPNNELSERTNRPRINGRIPDIFGTVRSVPDLITQPYRIFENNREVEYAYMCIGRGHYDVSEIRDGDTLVTDIAGMTVDVYGPFTSPNSPTPTPQLRLGTGVQAKVINTKRSNSVNGQVLRPSNLATVVGNNDISFAYPNKIVASWPGPINFTNSFQEGDELVVTNAARTGTGTTPGPEGWIPVGTAMLMPDNAFGPSFVNGGYIGLQIISNAATPAELPLPSGLVVGNTITLEQQLSPTGLPGGPVGSSDYSLMVFTGTSWVIVNGAAANLSGTYTITEISILNISYSMWSISVKLDNPGAVNPNWDLYGNVMTPYGLSGSDNNGAWTRTFKSTFGSSIPSFDLAGTYTILSVNAQTIVLSNPSLVNSDWNVLASIGSTPPMSPTLQTTGQKWIGPFTLREPDTVGIFCNFVAPNGLYMDNGTDQYAIMVELLVEVQKIDENDDPIPGIVNTFNVTISGSSTLKETVATTLNGKFYTFQGPCKVRATRISPTNKDFAGQVVDEVRWRDVYSYAHVNRTDFGNVTTVHSVTFATASALAVKERQLNMIVQRKIPERIGTTNTFTDTALVGTNRADSIFMAICRDRYIGNRSVSEVDVDNVYNTIADIEDYFGTDAAVEFSYTFDNDNLSFEETLGIVADAVFSIAFRRGSVISLTFEKETGDATLLFNHRNKLPGTEQRTFTFGTLEENDGLEYAYVNPADDSIISVFLPNTTPSSNPKKVESIGVRDHLQAYFHAWRIWNKMRYSNMTIEFDATQEAMLLVKSDRFLSTDSTRAGAQDGEVIAVDGLELTLSQNVNLTTDDTIFLQLYDGTTQAISVTAGSAANKVVLAVAPLVPLVTDSRQYARTAYILGHDNDLRQTAFLLTEKSANDGLISNVKGINYDARYYQNDSDYILGIIGRGGYGPGGGWGSDLGGVYVPPPAPEGLSVSWNWSRGSVSDAGFPPSLGVAVYSSVTNGSTVASNGTWSPRATFSSGGTSVGSLNYNPTIVEPLSNAVAIFCFRGSNDDGTHPSTVIYGGITCNVRWAHGFRSNGLANGSFVGIAICPLGSVMPSSKALEVTWPGWATGDYNLRFTGMVVNKVSSASYNFEAGLVTNTSNTNPISMQLTGLTAEGRVIAVFAENNSDPLGPDPVGWTTASLLQGDEAGTAATIKFGSPPWVYDLEFTAAAISDTNGYSNRVSPAKGTLSFTSATFESHFATDPLECSGFGGDIFFWAQTPELDPPGPTAFTAIEIMDAAIGTIYHLNAADATYFVSSGTISQWNWSSTGLSMLVGHKYRVKFFF